MQEPQAVDAGVFFGIHYRELAVEHGREAVGREWCTDGAVGAMPGTDELIFAGNAGRVVQRADDRRAVRGDCPTTPHAADYLVA